MLLALLSVAACAQESEEWRRAYEGAEKLRARYDEFLSHSTNGKLELRPIDEGIAPSGDSYRKYEMIVSGLPTEPLYDVMTWPVESEPPKTVLIGVSLGENGRVVCRGQKPE